MKTFRRPFWRATTSRMYIIFSIIVSIIITPLIYLSTSSVWSCVLFLVIWSLTCLPIYFTQYFYVVLTDGQLIFKNSIYTFWSKVYDYKDIIKIKIAPSINVYMEVFEKKQNKFRWSYVIDLVDPCDYDELIDMLRAKGIIVEANLDIRYPNRNKHKVEADSNYSDSDVQVFRQSWWNTSLIKKNLTFTAMVTIILAPFLLVATRSIWVCMGSVLACYMLFPVYFTRHFYVILSADKLIIKNGVYSSMQKEYSYVDITRIKVKRGRNIYMQVFMKKDEEQVKQYCIDLVAPKDYKLLVEMIKAKGITVETEGFEMYLV